MDEMAGFQIPEEAMEKLRDPKILKKQIQDGKTFQDIIGYSDDIMEKFYQAAYNLFQRELYAEASDAFIFLTTLNPYVHNYWLGLGMCEQKEGKFHEALMAYGMAILTDPTDPVAHYHSAFCYKAVEEPEKAVGSLTMAIECAADLEAHALLKSHAIMAKDLIGN